MIPFPPPPEVIVAPSVLAADFSRLGDEVARMEQAGADWIHLDVMDGNFVRNLTFGPDVVAAVRPRTKLPFDVHLMIEHPWLYLDRFIDAGSDLISVQLEALLPLEDRRWQGMGYVLRHPGPDAYRRAADRALELAERLQRASVRPGIVLNPPTPAEALEPLVTRMALVLAMTVWPGFGGQSFMSEVCEKLSEIKNRYRFEGYLEVDGGIKEETGRQAREAGANALVAGTYVFHSPDPRQAIASLRPPPKPR